MTQLQLFGLNYPTKRICDSLLINANCLEWMERIPESSFHAIVTDPPYGVKEYDHEQIEKRANGNGGIWRIPPAFDGHTRSPLPRFTALNPKERQVLRRFFVQWSKLAMRVLRPGGHLFLASNAFLSQIVFSSVVEGGLEFRGEIIRLVRTLRGGDRPKNAEEDFPGVSSLPRGCYEPWGLFRKPLLAGMTVSDCLRKFETGGLRRRPTELPFEDVIESERTPQAERKLVDHPSLKPQSFMRKLVHAALPLGTGIVLDPFAGSGSTLAAALALRFPSVGVERMASYFAQACEAVPKLAGIESEDGGHVALF